MKLSDYAGKGVEQVTDVNTPYLKLAQDITSACKKASADYINGLEPGMFFCAQTGKVFGTTIDVVVLATKKSYMILDNNGEFKGVSATYDPSWYRDDAGVLRTTDGMCPVLMYSFLVVTEDDLEHPMVFTLKKSDVASARDWNTKLKELRLENGAPAPIFGGVWRLKAVYREGKKGSWYAISSGKGGAVFVKFIEDANVDSIAALYDKAQSEQQGIASNEQTKLLDTEASGEEGEEQVEELPF